MPRAMLQMHDSPRPSVLVVDDNDDLRDALSCLLEQEGFAVEGADNGVHALEHLRSGVRPCLILLDLHMPVMDGFEFRSIQREDPTLTSIPVVIYSGAADLASDAEKLDVPNYFQKPLNLDALVALVHRFC